MSKIFETNRIKLKIGEATVYLYKSDYNKEVPENILSFKDFFESLENFTFTDSSITTRIPATIGCVKTAMHLKFPVHYAQTTILDQFVTVSEKFSPHKIIHHFRIPEIKNCSHMNFIHHSAYTTAHPEPPRIFIILTIGAVSLVFVPGVNTAENIPWSPNASLRVRSNQILDAEDLVSIELTITSIKN
jgi:hypothetical protein